jgi:hypothetical protein
MLYREIIPVCSQIHTKHINPPCGQSVELLNDELGDACTEPLGADWLIIPRRAARGR